MAKEYSSAPEVRDIAERLIEILKPELEGFEIQYVFCSEKLMHGGREVSGLARKVVGLNAFLAGHSEGFFVLETSKLAWDLMTENQRIAYVHHELCHFGISDEGSLTIIPHDIEEFNHVAEVHGEYHPGLVIFGAALRKGENSGTREEIKQRILNGE
ncbi:MAG: putative metallopeptidase [Pyrinomonadaceae bacterium]